MRVAPFIFLHPHSSFDNMYFRIIVISQSSGENHMKTQFEYGVTTVGAIFLALGLFGCGVRNQSPNLSSATPVTAKTPKPMAAPVVIKHQAAIDVVESKSIPKAVRSRMPKNGKSEFYGTFSLHPKGDHYALHFYSLGAKKPNFSLDFFRFKSALPSARLHFLNKLNFKGKDTNYNLDPTPTLTEFEGVKAQIFWVNPKTKVTPVLRLNCFVDGFYGTITNNYLMAFSSDFSGKTIVQQFGDSWDHNVANKSSYNELDSRGLMMVNLTTNFNGGLSQYRKLKWNGKMFKQKISRTAPSGTSH